VSYPSIEAIPQHVDLAVIATPADTVPGIIQECARASVPAAIVISAGFRETGATGAELEAACLEAARPGNVRILGPNCLGIIVPGINLNASFAAGTPSRGNIAFLSQSGALCTAALDWSIAENVGFSAFVSVGAMLDVGWGELLTHFGSDPETSLILCYMESIGDARQFLAAASQVSAIKPIIVLKVGHTESGAKAAASHTGSFTGKDSVLDAAFARARVRRVNTLSEFFNLAALASKQGLPKGPRLTILTNAGGPGALAADALATQGGQLAELNQSLHESLDAFLPSHWSRNNPIDLLGDATAQRYSEAIKAVITSGESDGLLVILTPQAMTQPSETAKALCALAQQTPQPVLTCWMGGARVASGKSILQGAGLPTFDFPDAAARAFVQLWQCGAGLHKFKEAPIVLESTPLSEGERRAITEIRDSVQNTDRKSLNPLETSRILSAYRIPALEARVALTEDEAVEQATATGFPVAVKLLSETVTHKSDVGGVKLNVASRARVREAWRAIQTAISQKRDASAFNGVSIQAMVKHTGYELILGSSMDAQLGPVILFGSGGALVEVYKDTALGIPPLDPAQALKLMEHTKIFTALKGVRGRAGVNIQALTELIVRFSKLAVEQSWISEIDINPLFASESGCLALDCRMLVSNGPATDPEA
jgi:acetyltransferase